MDRGIKVTVIAVNHVDILRTIGWNPEIRWILCYLNFISTKQKLNYVNGLYVREDENIYNIPYIITKYIRANLEGIISLITNITLAIGYCPKLSTICYVKVLESKIHHNIENIYPRSWHFTGGIRTIQDMVIYALDLSVGV